MEILETNAHSGPTIRRVAANEQSMPECRDDRLRRQGDGDSPGPSHRSLFCCNFPQRCAISHNARFHEAGRHSRTTPPRTFSQERAVPRFRPRRTANRHPAGSALERMPANANNPVNDLFASGTTPVRAPSERATDTLELRELHDQDRGARRPWRSADHRR